MTIRQDVKMALNDYQNWQRAQKQKARYQQRIANQRQDYLHKLTTALVKKYDVIVIEDLKRVSRMLCKKGNFARMNWQF